MHSHTNHKQATSQTLTQPLKIQDGHNSFQFLVQEFSVNFNSENKYAPYFTKNFRSNSGKVHGI